MKKSGKKGFIPQTEDDWMAQFAQQLMRGHTSVEDFLQRVPSKMKKRIKERIEALQAPSPPPRSDAT